MLKVCWEYIAGFITATKPLKTRHFMHKTPCFKRPANACIRRSRSCGNYTRKGLISLGCRLGSGRLGPVWVHSSARGSLFRRHVFPEFQGPRQRKSRLAAAWLPGPVCLSPPPQPSATHPGEPHTAHQDDGHHQHQGQLFAGLLFAVHLMPSGWLQAHGLPSQFGGGLVACPPLQRATLGHALGQ